MISSKANGQKKDGGIVEFIAILAYLIDSRLGRFRPEEAGHTPYARRDLNELIDIVIDYIREYGLRNPVEDSRNNKASPGQHQTERISTTTTTTQRGGLGRWQAGGRV